jgi:nucleoside-diphosphate-sugar epimerase
VVVTGGAGRLGRYVVDELSQAYEVIVADVSRPVDALPRPVDVLDLGAVTEVLAGADAVVHLAALDYDTHARSEEFMRVNALGTWNVLLASESAGVGRAVVCSSVAALGLHERRHDWTPLSLPVDESHPVAPAEAYSVSKLVVETMCQSFVRASGLPILCIRPVAIVFDAELETFLGTVDGSVPSLFDYVMAGDVARAVRLGLAAGWSGYECLLLSAADTAHPEPTLGWYPRLVGALPADVDHAVFDANPRASVFSSARAESVLGWRPASDFSRIRAGGAAMTHRRT